MEQNIKQGRNWEKEREALKEFFGEMGFLYKWIDSYPQLAPLVTFELRQLSNRYVEDPAPDSIEIRTRVPLAIMAKWLNCYDVERAETLFLQAMNDEIERHNAGYVSLKTSVPLSMYEQFEKACSTLEGKEVEEEHLPAYIQSVLCKAIQDFIKQRNQPE